MPSAEDLAMALEIAMTEIMVELTEDFKQYQDGAFQKSTVAYPRYKLAFC